MTAEKDKRLHMVGNAHIDPVWLWRWPEGLHEVTVSFKSALERMREYEDFFFTSSSALFYEWIEQSDPEMFAEIRRRVDEGRWEIVGGWWNQPDCNLPCGEAFVRQGLYGQRYFKAKFGRIAEVGYNVDSFGHHAALPQILRKSGLQAYVFLRPAPEEKGLPGRLFWWESDDGSRVLAYRIPFEYSSGAAELEMHVRRCAPEMKPPVNDLLCFYGVGNHGGGPTRANIESIRRLRREAGQPELLFSTVGRFFEEVRRQKPLLPTVHQELQHHASGTYAAHSGVKQWNRHAENLLLFAEKYCAAAECVLGRPSPVEALTRGWKSVLFNQFHDILAGTSIESAYADARDLFGEANAIAARCLNNALQALLWRIRIEPEAGSLPVVVFNPHAWSGEMSVELETETVPSEAALLDDQGVDVPFQLVQPEAATRRRCRLAFVADLPALGYRTYKVCHRAASTERKTGGLEAGPTFIANKRFRLEFDESSGAIKSLRDKDRGVELFSGLAARAVVLDDPSDTWSHGVFRFDRAIGVFNAASLRCIEHGPVRALVRAESEYGRSRLIQDFIVYADLLPIEVRVTVDWQERQRALKLRFPMNFDFVHAVFEIPYGVVQRAANGEEEPGQTWLDVSGCSRNTGERYGMSLMNDGKYSFDVFLNEIGMTVLRSPVYAHHDPFKLEPDARRPVIDHGLHSFSYALLPHRGSWDEAAVHRRAAELNTRPIACATTFHSDGVLPQSAAILWAEPDNIMTTVFKRAEDSSDMIVRAFETAKTATDARIHLPCCSRTIDAHFAPCEIKTLRVPRDPAAPCKETNLLEWE